MYCPRPRRIRLFHGGSSAANMTFGDGHAAAINETQLPSGEVGAPNPLAAQSFLNKTDTTYTAEQYALTWVARPARP